MFQEPLFFQASSDIDQVVTHIFECLLEKSSRFEQNKKSTDAR